jgi:uncharacterized delta-60 repeat protein
LWSAAAADVVAPDGSVVTAGQAHLSSGDQIIATRYTPSGQPDPSFGHQGVVTVDIGGVAGVDSGAGLARAADGSILIAGTGAAGGHQDFAIVRLLPNGTPDPGFANHGVATIPVGDVGYANAILVDRAGNIDVAGTARVGAVNHFAVIRLTPHGTLDPTFGTGGITILPPYAADWGMVLQPDGSLVLGGQELHNGTQTFMAARVRPNGTLDPTYGTGGIVTLPVGASAVGYAINIQPDGKIILGGNGNTADGTPIAAIARLNTNGTLDPTFATHGILQFPGGGLNLMTIDPAGHIYLAGVGATLIRLNPNGTPDTTFAHNSLGIYCNGTDCAANGIAIDPTTGKLVLSGITHINGYPEILTFRTGG